MPSRPLITCRSPSSPTRISGSFRPAALQHRRDRGPGCGRPPYDLPSSTVSGVRSISAGSICYRAVSWAPNGTGWISRAEGRRAHGWVPNDVRRLRTSNTSFDRYPRAATSPKVEPREQIQWSPANLLRPAKRRATRRAGIRRRGGVPCSRDLAYILRASFLSSSWPSPSSPCPRVPRRPRRPAPPSKSSSLARSR